MSKLREQILDLVKQYADQKHQTKPFAQGERIHYSGRVFDSSEVAALVDSALEFWLTSGKYTDQFERMLADYIGVEYCAFVNSGSSANLLAFMALTSPLLEERAIKRGDEVITVAAGFPTTITPIIQFGAVPVFVDVAIPQYNIDTDLLQNAVSSKTKAVILAHTLGNPFDIAAVKAFCEKRNLWLIEDNCDALGARYTLNGKTRRTGSFGDLGTSSFYPPHHITTGEGGAVYTGNPLLSKIVRSIRDWGRGCVCAPGQDDLCGNRFNGQFGDLPQGYDHKYVYSNLGFNLKATDMQAAIGCAQLEKIDRFIEKRNQNFAMLKALLSDAQDKLILPEPCKNSVPSWFGFPMMCRKGTDRNHVVRRLENNKIQTRMLFAGNMVRQPCMKGVEYRISGELLNTDSVMDSLFWVGVYPGIDGHAVEYMAQMIREAISIS